MNNVPLSLCLPRFPPLTTLPGCAIMLPHPHPPSMHVQPLVSISCPSSPPSLLSISLFIPTLPLSSPPLNLALYPNPAPLFPLSFTHPQPPPPSVDTPPAPLGSSISSLPPPPVSPPSPWLVSTAVVQWGADDRRIGPWESAEPSWCY